MDNYELWKNHDDEEQDWLERLPKCDICGEPIQDDYLWKIEHITYCRGCLDDKFRYSVEVDY